MLGHVLGRELDGLVAHHFEMEVYGVYLAVWMLLYDALHVGIPQVLAVAVEHPGHVLADVLGGCRLELFDVYWVCHNLVTSLGK